MLIMFYVSANAFAQNIEQIYMKNGSIINGYIAEQIPGKQITLQTEEATIVVNSDSLLNRITERIPSESLSQEWKEWAEQNDKYVKSTSGKSLELTTLEFKNSTFHRVFLLEKGSLIKFLDLGRSQYTFAWGDMYRSVKNRRPENLFSGVKEIVVLDDGTEITGQIIEQFPGRNLKILTDDEEVLSFKFSQVQQIRTEKLSDKLDLWSQIQFLDQIQVK